MPLMSGVRDSERHKPCSSARSKDGIGMVTAIAEFAADVTEFLS
jgi:hypothetical protein